MKFYLLLFSFFILVSSLAYSNEKKLLLKINDIVICAVTEGYLNIRESPILDSKVIGKLYIGQKAQIMEIDPKVSELKGKSFHWINIKTLPFYSKLVQGWAASLYLEKLINPLKLIPKKDYIRINLSIKEKNNTNNWAQFSPDSKWLVVQAGGYFYIIPINKQKKDFAVSYQYLYPGYMIGFISKTNLIYSNQRGVYQLNIKKLESKYLIFSYNDIHGVIYPNKHFIFYKNRYIIKGNYKGNYIYDLKRKKRLKLKLDSLAKSFYMAKFWQYRLSATSRYFSHEYGDEDTNYTDVYDLKRNRNINISRHFNFRKYLKKLKSIKFNSVGLFWLARVNKLLCLVSPSPFYHQTSYLVLLDFDKRKILWLKKIKEITPFPTDVGYLNKKSLIISGNDRKKVVVLNLKSGRHYIHKKIKVQTLSVSPDRRKAAYINFKDPGNFMGHVEIGLIHFLGYKQKKLAVFKDIEIQRAYKGIKAESPIWTPNGKYFIVIGSNAFLLFKVHY